MRFTEILFPTDFSQASEAAGRIARAMALEAGARLHTSCPRSPIPRRALRASRRPPRVSAKDFGWRRPC